MQREIAPSPGVTFANSQSTRFVYTGGIIRLAAAMSPRYRVSVHPSGNSSFSLIQRPQVEGCRRRRWTVHLLTDKAVELDCAPSVSHNTVQRLPRKSRIRLSSGSTGKSRHRGTIPRRGNGRCAEDISSALWPGASGSMHRSISLVMSSLKI